ncbi:hypothetical protein [Pelagibius sp.]|uniref:hypothetical protein n=1 Tax=Pelagibius sp. TaxID=1931238 RepID=UPI002621CCEA|nr:hypothetical protein [Pelagibius sp.]
MVEALPYILFGLIWFRVHESPGTLFPQPLFGTRSPAFIAFAALAFLLIWLPAYLFAFPMLFQVLETARTGAPQSLSIQLQGYILLPATMLVWLYVIGRLSQILPAAAFDEDLSVWGTWKATAGNGVRLLAAYVLAGFPVLILVGFLVVFAISRGHFDGSNSTAIATQGTHVAERALTGLMTAVLWLALAALLAVVATEAYRRLTGRTPKHQV